MNAAPLEILPLSLRFTAPAPRRMPANPGSAWRGALGHALRRRVCVTGATDCGGCALHSGCAYPSIFEPAPPGDGFLAQYPDAPAGYVLAPTIERELAPGAQYHLGLTLFGRNTEYRQLLVDTLRVIGERGLKPDAPWQWGGVKETATPAPPPAAPDSVTVELLSPLRLRIQNRYVRPDALDFGPMFSALLRRISQLAAVHGTGAPDIDASALVQHAQGLRLEPLSLHWRDNHRWSSRQRQSMPTGGIVGRFRLHGDIGPVWPWLWFGQWCHVGKFTVIGLGRYRLIPDTEPSAGGSSA